MTAPTEPMACRSPLTLSAIVRLRGVERMREVLIGATYVTTICPNGSPFNAHTRKRAPVKVAPSDRA